MAFLASQSSSADPARILLRLACFGSRVGSGEPADRFRVCVEVGRCRASIMFILSASCLRRAIRRAERPRSAKPRPESQSPTPSEDDGAITQ